MAEKYTSGVTSHLIIWMGRIPSLLLGLLRYHDMEDVSLASSPHPSVSGLVMTVCACVDFSKKTWENVVNSDIINY